MEMLNFFAMVGMTINDLISLYSLTGIFMLFIGSFFSPPRFRDFGNWSILGLAFGLISQVSMEVTDSMPEKIGIVFQMSSWTVNFVLLLSLLLLFVQWQIKRNRRRLV